MIDALLAPVYKWLVLALLVVVLALWWHNSHLSQKLNTAQTTVQQEIEKALKPYLDANKLIEDTADAVSARFEVEKSNEKQKTNAQEKRIEIITRDIVYTGVCFNADGVSELNKAGSIPSKHPP